MPKTTTIVVPHVRRITTNNRHRTLLRRAVPLVPSGTSVTILTIGERYVMANVQVAMVGSEQID